jgi:hypothetical protein
MAQANLHLVEEKLNLRKLANLIPVQVTPLRPPEGLKPSSATEPNSTHHAAIRPRADFFNTIGQSPTLVT